MKFTQIRTHYTKVDTLSTVLKDGIHYCYCLEDTVRQTKKLKGRTAIAPGLYELTVDFSPRFKRDMVRIKNVPNFQGIRIHGGNNHKHTAGCPLWARNFWNNGEEPSQIQGSMEREVTRDVWKAKDRGEKIYLEIINTTEVH